MHLWSEQRAALHAPYAHTIQGVPRASAMVTYQQPGAHHDENGRRPVLPPGHVSGLSSHSRGHSHTSSDEIVWPQATSPRRTPMTMAGPAPLPPTNAYMSRPYSASSIHSQGSTPSSTDSVDRVIIQATLDNESFSVVNVTGIDSAPTIREMILRKLKLPWKDLSQWGLIRTEIGESDVGNSPLIDDDTLLSLCLQFGDDKGTVKFRVLQRRSVSDEPHEAPVVYASPMLVPQHTAPATLAWPGDSLYAPHQPPPVPYAPPNVARTVVPRRQPWIPTAPAGAPQNIKDTFLPPLTNRHMSPAVVLPPSQAPSFPYLQPGMLVPTSNMDDKALRGSPRPISVHGMSSSRPAPSTHHAPTTAPNGRPASFQLDAPFKRDPDETVPRRVLKPSKPPALSSSSDVGSPQDENVYPNYTPPVLHRSDSSSGPRPLPVPSPISSASPASAQMSPWRQDTHSESTDHISSDRSTQSDHGGDSSMQRLMAHLRVSQERKNASTSDAPAFDSFADDTLGGTFAQPLDASTLTSRPRDADTLRPSPSTLTPRDASRPVLTLSISPPPEPKAPSQASATTVASKSSQDSHRQSWAFRPPPEELYEQLDNLFPRHDLDQPLSDMALSPQTSSEMPLSAQKEDRIVAAGTPSTKPRRAPRGLSRHQHHSIRIIAQNRRQLLEKTKQEERRSKLKNEEVLSRRKSTKLWGGRMVEMRTNGANSVGIVPDGNTHGSTDPDTQPVFRWVKGDLIGKGTYGRVYLALNATTGEMIAVKQVELPRTAADRDSSRQRSIVSALKSEIETLKDLDHPNVVTCLGFEETLDTLSIFLEYVPGGSIGSCLRRYGKFEEDMTSSFLNQTLQGLAYLHKQGILHRDLKADNLLVDYQGTCKISDFGTVRRSEDIYANVENMSLQGSIFWMAPEVVSLSRKGYSAKVDIWSLGCVVLEMLAGRRPWSDEEAVQAMFKIGAERRAPPVPKDVKISKPAAHFLRNCFEIDPDRRPTAARLLEHVFAWPSPNWCFEDSGLYMLLCPPK